MKRLTVFSLALLLSVFSIASITHGSTQDDRRAPRGRAWTFGPELFERGSFMGVSLDEVDSEAVQRLRLREERGALVTDVTPDGPAAQSGLKKDDVIVRWNGQPIESVSQLMRHRRETPPGRTVRLGVIRDGREMELDLKLGDRNAMVARTRPRMAIGEPGGRSMIFTVSDRGRLGASLQSLTPQLGEYFGLSNRKGVLVSSVAENSAAAKAGLQAGDVILSVGGEDVDSPTDVTRLIRARNEGPVEVKILRNKQERSLSIQLEKRRVDGSGSSSEEFEELIGESLNFGFELPQIDMEFPSMMELPSIAIPNFELPEIEHFSEPLVFPLPRLANPEILKLNRVYL